MELIPLLEQYYCVLQSGDLKTFLTQTSGKHIYHRGKYIPYWEIQGFPHNSKNHLQCRRPQFNSWIGKIHQRRDRLPTPVFLGFPCGSAGKESPAMWETWAQSLGWEEPLDKGKATRSSILVYRIPWTVKSTGLQRVGHN